MWRFFFKRVGLFLALASPLLAPIISHGQISPPLTAKLNRIGDTISMYEREYFGLFTKTKDFAFATLGREARGAAVTIHYTNGQPPTKMIIDGGAIGDLYDFTNKYEYYAADASDKFRPARLMVLDLRLPLTKYERNGRQVDVYSKNGAVEFGEILSVNDSILKIWLLDLEYDWEFVPLQVKSYKFSELSKIAVYKRVPSQWIGGAVGLATALAVISTGNHFPDLGSEAASGAVMIPSYAAVGFGLGYAFESLFRFKQQFYRFDPVYGKLLNEISLIQNLKKHSMFPGKVPPEFVRQP